MRHFNLKKQTNLVHRLFTPQKAFIIFFAIFLSPKAAALSLEQFQEKMRRHVDLLPKKTKLSLQMELLGGGTLLFGHRATEKMLPASSAKLLTSAASLEKMGPAFSFQTRVFEVGKDLVLEGNGDPYLVSERLWLLARDVARSGVKEVHSIRVNTAAFSENYKGLMDWRDSGEPFTAMVSPTSLNFNSVEIHVWPGEKGKAHVEAGPVPNGYAILQNEVSTVGDNKKTLSVRPLRSEQGREHFLVSGQIGRNSPPVIVYASVAQPEAHIAAVFAALLRKEGIKVEKDFGGVDAGPMKNGSRLVAELESLPLLDLVRLLNTYSNNFMTEQLFQALGAKVLGGQAGLSKSRQVMKEFLDKTAACEGSDFDNGSGLSWNTKVSAQCFVQILQGAHKNFSIFADLLGAMPIGGQTGTLKNRFRSFGEKFDAQSVRAKTGTIWSKQAVTSLVGFTRAGSGEKVIFAILENDERNDRGLLPNMRDWENKCVELIQQLQL